MPHQILFLDHAPSPNTRRLGDAAATAMESGSTAQVIRKTPLEARADDALKADGILISTTENSAIWRG